MNKGEKRYRIAVNLTLQELTCMGRDSKGYVLHDQEGTEIIMSQYGVDQLNISKVMLAGELEEKLRHRLGQVQDYLKRHKQKFNPMDKPNIVHMPMNLREIHQYDLKGRYLQTFSSIKEALLSVGANTSHSNLHRVCRRTGRYFSFKGFRWDYEKMITLPPLEKYSSLRK